MILTNHSDLRNKTKYALGDGSFRPRFRHLANSTKYTRHLWFLIVIHKTRST